MRRPALILARLTPRARARVVAVVLLPVATFAVDAGHKADRQPSYATFGDNRVDTGVGALKFPLIGQ